MSDTVGRRKRVAATLAPSLAVAAFALAYTVAARGCMAPAPSPRNAALNGAIETQCCWLLSGSVVLALSSAVAAAIGRGGGRRRLVLAWVILTAWWLLALGAARYAFGVE
jgi:hypothetical protein